MTDLNAQLSQLSPAKRKLLEAYLERKRQASVGEEVVRAPASFVQEELWLAERGGRGRSVYNVPLLYASLEGALDLRLLERALAEIVRRHGALRTTLRVEDGALTQRVAPAGDFQLLVDERAGLSEAEQLVVQRDVMEQEGGFAFDVARGPLFRARVVRFADDRHLLLTTAHHAVVDAFSTSVFLDELGKLYAAYAAKLEPPLPPLTTSYAQYAREQRASGLESRAKNALHWRDRLQGMPPLLLPQCAQDAPATQRQGGHELFTLDEQLFAAVKRFSREHGLTVQMTLLAAFQCLLERASGQTDFPVGLPVAQRDGHQQERLIGLFAGQLVVRAQLQGDPSFLEVAQRVRANVLDALTHRNVSFNDVVSGAGQGVGERGFIQAIFDFINGSVVPNLTLPGITVKPLLGREWFSDFMGVDLFLLLWPEQERLNGCLGYNAGRFSAQFATALIDCLRTLLHQVLEPAGALRQAGGRLLSSLEPPALPATSERAREPAIALAANFDVSGVQRVLSFWCDTLAMPVKLFAAQPGPLLGQLLSPHGRFASNREGLNILLIRPDPNLDEAALCAALEASNARTSLPTLIALCEFEREPLLARRLAALPGVTLLAAHELTRYLPAPEAASAERHSAALATALARATRTLIDWLPKVIVVDCDHTLWGGVVGEEPSEALLLAEEHLALQRALVAQARAGVLICLCSRSAEADVMAVFDQRPDMVLRRAQIAAVRCGDDDKAAGIEGLARELGLASASFAFLDDDPLEVEQVRARLPEVASVCLPRTPELRRRFLDELWLFDRPRTTREDGLRLEHYRREHARAALRDVTRDFADFVRELGIEVRLEPLCQDELGRAAQLARRATRFHSAAGSWSASLRAGQELLGVHVSDRLGAYGLVGVLACEASSQSLRVRLFVLSCRALHRGVEQRVLAALGERAHGRGLHELAIDFVETERNDVIAGFLRTASDLPDSEAGYRISTERARQLPEQLSPEPRAAARAPTPSPVGRVHEASWEQVANLAGSSDALLAAVKRQRVRARPALDTAYRAPSSALQRQLAALWADVLELDRVGVDDDFFALGGSSLQALRLVAQACRLVGRELPATAMFDQATVAHLESQLRSASAGERGQWGELVPLGDGAGERRLFCVHGLDGEASVFGALARQLGAGWSVCGVRLHTAAQLPDADALAVLAADYLSVIRRAQPQGPYALLGWSVGGLIAQQIARQLRTQGEQIHFLALLDTHPARMPGGAPAPLLAVLHALGGEIAQELLGTVQQLRTVQSAAPQPSLLGLLEEHSAAWLLSFLVASCGLPRAQLGSTYRELQALARPAQLGRVRELALSLGTPSELLDTDALERSLDKQRRLFAAALAHAPAALSLRTLLFLPEAPPAFGAHGANVEAAWRELVVPAPVVHRLGGDHFTMLNRPYVQHVARVLEAEAARREAPGDRKQMEDSHD
jgi:FkbH-like protein